MADSRSHTKIIISLITAGVLFSCSKEITRRNFPKKEIIPSVNTHTLNVYGDRHPINVVYLGCGHLVIRYFKEIILIDPFFSTQGFVQGRISSNPAAFEKYKSILAGHAIDLPETKSVWIAHTHYDHMMDIPMMLEKNLLPKEAILYGNSFGDDFLAKFISPQQYHTLEEHEVFNPASDNVRMKWFTVNMTNIRVMPILSDHAPHYKLGPLSFHLMKGDAEPGYFSSHLKEANDTTKRNCWKEGTTYSYLVDFMEKGNIAFRLFIQTSASHYPLGCPPASVLKERAVDVAFLCAASANFVKPYPAEVLDTLKPRKVVFIHWEDFFREPLDFDGARFVRFTNFRKLNRTLKRHGFELNKEDYVMPRPGTMLTIK